MTSDKPLFSLVLPTRHHLNLVSRFLDSIAATTEDLSSLEIVLYVDDDDLESQKIDDPRFNIRKLIGKSHTMGNITREAVAKARGEYIFLTNDDLVFRTRGWDTKTAEIFKRFPDGIVMVYGNDLYYGKRIATFPIITRKACKLMDQVCPGSYRSHCIDDHIWDIFTRLKKFGHNRAIYMKDVVFEHMHYEMGIASCAGKDDLSDQDLYISFSGQRANVCAKMVKAISDYAQTHPRCHSGGMWHNLVAKLFGNKK